MVPLVPPFLSIPENRLKNKLSAWAGQCLICRVRLPNKQENLRLKIWSELFRLCGISHCCRHTSETQRDSKTKQDEHLQETCGSESVLLKSTWIMLWSWWMWDVSWAASGTSASIGSYWNWLYSPHCSEFVFFTHQAQLKGLTMALPSQMTVCFSHLSAKWWQGLMCPA